MNWLEALLLGILQGLTEFLPVSSSGHLTIAQELLNLNTTAADNLQFIVVVHAATVLSTIVILWKEISFLFKGTFCTKVWNDEKSYVLKIIISMIPVFIVGVFFKDQVEALFGQGILLVGCCLLVTALLLTFAYYAKPRQKENISYRDAFIIGLSQAVAVLPGLSRSGTTIATGLLLGNKKEKVAQFSFLMVLVPILGETLLDVIKMIKEPVVTMGVGVFPLVIGFLGAFAAGCFACKFMINLVKRGKLIYFAIYCAIIGIISIVYAVV
ncbi:undecaprenyl-diphosphate phosphatase [Paludibacter sp. 221]|uniref:undecaprenyl-diphosphate phosphatase n=1 Tax=Paludibacter sp. 221 TaxID=2302939 RepID=UPI0013D05C83|nr:undecaprenyl-diphosphate phosphatase [Paludibacter sp. 221]NDV47585.1 undecaprenyl-diphosphate phosphatase [Paludibacter sp. 221]